MSDEGLLSIIAKVRRLMPRNEDVLALCDGAERCASELARDRERMCQYEKVIAEEAAALAQPPPRRLKAYEASIPPSDVSRVPGAFDKRSYMREYMRRRREAKKAEGGDK